MGLNPGKQIGDYRLGDRIAKGGMGEVWRALDLARNEPVAIKVVSNDLFSEPGFRDRIQDEASRHQRLHHPNIVPVLDVFEADGNTCIVMKLLDGKSLTDLLKSKPNNCLSVAEAISIIKDILSALDYAHRNGVIHRDIKPSNILLDENNRAIVIDFGIAIAVGEKRRTRTGQIVGTPLYMSPEQITRPKNINHLSDVYSTGCLFYEMLTGRPPFMLGDKTVGNSEFAVQQAHVQQTPVPPRLRNFGIPAYLDNLIMKALEKNPEERIPGCQEFSRLLDISEQKTAKRQTKLQEWFNLYGPWIILATAILAALLLLLLFFI